MRFKVLGPLELEADGASLALGGLRQRAVLASLLAERNHVLSADRLIDMVWEGDPPASASATLQTYVSHLRRVLSAAGRDGAAVIETRPPGYVLHTAPNEVDADVAERTVDEASAALDRGDPARARELVAAADALWRGEPYADLADAESLRHEITRLAALRDRAALVRLEAGLALGLHAELVPELERMVAVDPLHEGLRAHLMLALYRCGRQADALRVYADTRERLAEELGLDPGPELRRLELRILEHDPSLGGPATPAVAPAVPVAPAAPTAPPAARSARPGELPFVGRDAAIAAGQAALHRATSGHGTLLFITGEAGIGKTRLAAEIAADAAAMGLPVHWGRCLAMDGAPPMWAWVDIARSAGADRSLAWARALTDGDDPESGGGEPRAAQFRLADTLARFVLRADTVEVSNDAAAAPWMIVLEDVQWADAGSLAVLQLVAERLADAPVVVVATARTDHTGAVRSVGGDLDRLAGSLQRAAATVRVALEPLGVEDVRTLVAASGLQLPEGAAALVHHRAAGNAFFVAELLAHLAAAGDGAALDALPATIRDVVRERIAALPDGARAWVRLAAYAFDDFGVTVVPQRILGMDDDDQLAAAEAALAAGVIVEAPDLPGRFRFAHGLIRDAIMADESSARRAHTHLKLGELLLDANQYGTRSQRELWLMHHWCEAAGMGRAKDGASMALSVARRSLASYAADAAVAQARRGLVTLTAHDVDDPALETDLRIVLVTALRRLDLLDEVHREVTDLMDAARRTGDADRLAQAALARYSGALGRFTIYGGVLEDGVAALEEALAALPITDTAVRVQVMARLARELLFQPGARDRADHLSAGAVTSARRLGEPRTLCHALAARHLVAWSLHSHGERAALSAEMLAVATAAGLEDEGAAAWLIGFADRMEAGAGLELLDELERTQAAARRDGRVAVLAPLGWMRAHLAQLAGRFDEAERLATEAHDEMARLDPDEAFGAFAGFLAALRWDQGRLAELESGLRDMIALQPHLATSWHIALAWFLASEGRTDEATAELHVLAPTLAGGLPEPALRSGLAAAFAEAAYLTGHREAVEAAAAILEGADVAVLLADSGTYWFGATDHFRGSLRSRVGRHDEAIALLTAAAELHQRLGSPVWEGRSRLRLAHVLADAGRADEAAAMFARAAALAAEVGHRGLDRELAVVAALVGPAAG